MKFTLIDRILTQQPDRVVAVKQVSAAEEYLADHFPGYPVLPGVFMIEAMVQAARVLTDPGAGSPYVLGQVKALKYGSFVRPGESLEVEVTRDRIESDGTILFRGTGRVRRIASDEANEGQSAAPAMRSGEQSSVLGETAVSGRFTMRPVRRSVPGTEPAPSGMT